MLESDRGHMSTPAEFINDLNSTNEKNFNIKVDSTLKPLKHKKGQFGESQNCKCCNNTYADFVSLVSHLCRPFRCSICQSRFQFLWEVKMHKSTQHKSKSKLRSRNNSLLHTCKHCGKSYRTWKMLWKHSLECVKKPPNKCDICKTPMLRQRNCRKCKLTVIAKSDHSLRLKKLGLSLCQSKEIPIQSFESEASAGSENKRNVTTKSLNPEVQFLKKSKQAVKRKHTTTEDFRTISAFCDEPKAMKASKSALKRAKVNTTPATNVTKNDIAVQKYEQETAKQKESVKTLRPLSMEFGDELKVTNQRSFRRRKGVYNINSVPSDNPNQYNEPSDKIPSVSVNILSESKSNALIKSFKKIDFDKCHKDKNLSACALSAIAVKKSTLGIQIAAKQKIIVTETLSTTISSGFCKKLETTKKKSALKRIKGVKEINCTPNSDPYEDCGQQFGEVTTTSVDILAETITGASSKSTKKKYSGKRHKEKTLPDTQSNLKAKRFFIRKKYNQQNGKKSITEKLIVEKSVNPILEPGRSAIKASTSKTSVGGQTVKRNQKEELRNATEIDSLINSLPDSDSGIILLSRHENMSSFCCAKCNKLFKLSRLASIHYSSCKAKPKKKLVPVANVKWVCTFCHADFDRYSELVQHKKYCTILSTNRSCSSQAIFVKQSVKNYPNACINCCSKCGYRCISIIRFQGHSCSERLENMQSCYVHLEKLCKVDFNTDGQLLIYEYECNVCKNVFIDNFLYNRHKEKHPSGSITVRPLRLRLNPRGKGRCFLIKTETSSEDNHANFCNPSADLLSRSDFNKSVTFASTSNYVHSEAATSSLWNQQEPEILAATTSSSNSYNTQGNFAPRPASNIPGVCTSQSVPFFNNLLNITRTVLPHNTGSYVPTNNPVSPLQVEKHCYCSTGAGFHGRDTKPCLKCLEEFVKPFSCNSRKTPTLKVKQEKSDAELLHVAGLLIIRRCFHPC